MPNHGSNQGTEQDIQSQLAARYGVTMSTQEVAETLKMSVAALRMARSRNRLPLQPIRIDGLRNQIYFTADVGHFLASRSPQPKEAPM
jgi:hypothetical protein